MTCESKPETSRISETFLRYDLFLKKFLTRFFASRQDIEDVAQETYLRAYIADNSREIRQPKAYLFRIAKNIALTELTKKSRQITGYIEDMGGSVVIETTSEDNNGVDAELEAQQSLGLYCEALASLPEKCRQVFILRKVHGLAHKEIAMRMSLSVSSVEKYLMRAVLVCREFVDAREGANSSLSRRSAGKRLHGKDRQ